MGGRQIIEARIGKALGPLATMPLADVFDEIEWDDEYDAAKVRHRQTGTPARTTVIESVTAKLRAALLEAAA